MRSYQRSSCRRFSSFSATWSCISCAVAPGQAVMMVITLTVKAGSSARPSLKNATRPASEIRQNQEQGDGALADRERRQVETAFAHGRTPSTAATALARHPHLLAFAQQVRAERDDAVALLELARDDACAVVFQALDHDRPPGDLGRLAADDPHARPLAGIEQGADGHLQAALAQTESCRPESGW